MANFSKGHERDENRRMNKGLIRSLFAVLFCWLPVAGLALAAGGFLRVAVRVTQAHRVKKTLLLILTLVVLVGCIGVLGAEIYYYTRDPSILDQAIHHAWYALTGQKTLPWAAPSASDALPEPEDAYAGYGADPYAVDLYADSGDDLSDYDADFDDSELQGFEEDASADEGPAQKALFDQMRESKTDNSLLPKG